MKTCTSSRLVCTQRPDPGALALEQRHHDAEREQVAGGQVGDRDADAHRALAGQAGDAHQAAHALRDLVDAGAGAVGPGLAEAADAAIDQARVDRVDVVPGDLQPVLHVGAHVLDDHVGACAPAS